MRWPWSRVIAVMHASWPVDGFVRSHRITSTTAPTLDPPFDEFTISEKEDQVPIRFAAVDTSHDLFELVVFSGVHNFHVPTTVNVPVVEKLRDLILR